VLRYAIVPMLHKTLEKSLASHDMLVGVAEVEVAEGLLKEFQVRPKVLGVGAEGYQVHSYSPESAHGSDILQVQQCCTTF